MCLQEEIATKDFIITVFRADNIMSKSITVLLL